MGRTESSSREKEQLFTVTRGFNCDWHSDTANPASTSVLPRSVSSISIQLSKYIQLWKQLQSLLTTLKSCLCQYSDGSPDHFSYFMFVSTNMAEIWQIFLKGSKSSWSWLSIRSQSIILGLTIFWNLLWMNFKMIFNKSLKENWELKFYFYQ